VQKQGEWQNGRKMKWLDADGEDEKYPDEE